MIDKEVKKIFRSGIFKGEIKFDQPMSRYTSLRIGGPVDIMVFPEDSTSLKNVLISAMRENIPIFVLGAGTNLLVRDEGVDAIAVSLKAFKRIEVIQSMTEIFPYIPHEEDSDASIGFFVEAGVPINRLINFTKKNGYSGIEALVGIPGTFGGAVCMNAGSFGTEIKDVIISMALMKMDGRIVVLGKEELKFSYRTSNIPNGDIILSANVVFKKDTPESVAARIGEFLRKKKRSQPIGQPSAGCVFKNPVGIDSYREEDSAGRLIESAGCKGMRIGDVEVSTLHANYFINKGRATCKDFVELMEIVKAKVKVMSGITLEPEIKIIGRGR